MSLQSPAVVGVAVAAGSVPPLLGLDVNMPCFNASDGKGNNINNVFFFARVQVAQTFQ